MKTFFIAISGVKTKDINNENYIYQTQNISFDLMKGLNYILANKYEITMPDYKSLKVEIKEK